jgi:hypothetical protein
VKIFPDGDLGLEGLGEQLYQILCAIGEPSECGDPRVATRFFPDPLSTGEGDSLLEDWKAFVVPDLQIGFQSARHAVAEDLRRAEKSEDGLMNFRIPARHIHFWVSALTQARLALAELHEFSEADMQYGPTVPETPREFALLQFGIYGMMLEWLVRVID